MRRLGAGRRATSRVGSRRKRRGLAAVVALGIAVGGVAVVSAESAVAADAPVWLWSRADVFVDNSGGQHWVDDSSQNAAFGGSLPVNTDCSGIRNNASWVVDLNLFPFAPPNHGVLARRNILFVPNAGLSATLTLPTVAQIEASGSSGETWNVPDQRFQTIRVFALCHNDAWDGSEDFQYRIHETVDMDLSPPEPTTTTTTLPPEPDYSITVNTDTDESDADTADFLCDTEADGNDDASSRQCTLRAAIEEANQRQLIDEEQEPVIEFDIPGGTPTITPGTALPELTGVIAVDGTTQTGGWVVLKGLGSGSEGTFDGLRFVGVNEEVRGLVVQGFERGLVLGGDGGHVVTGMRIGTDAAGMTTDDSTRNSSGIEVVAPDVVIGSETGGGSQCSGACVLIAGSSVDIRIDAGNAKVFGAFLGTDVNASTKLGDLGGIEVEEGGLGATIGDATGTTGRAPGNVIVGDTPIVLGAPSTVAGNLVNVSPTGQVLRTTYRSAIQVEEEAEGAIVGGDTAEHRNVIGGSTEDVPGNTPVLGGAGIEVWADDVKIEHNHLGVAADGTTPAPNRLGIRTVGPGNTGSWSWDVLAENTTIHANVVSGNTHIGILLDGTGAQITGNRVGTNAAGTAAVGQQQDGILPNKDDSGTVVGGPGGVTAGGCVDPCNLISGNTEVGLHGSGQGNMIGTDLTGTVAVPNGVGVLLWYTSVLGEAGTSALDGCDGACNLVSGNASTGVATATQGGTDTHFIGGVADGHVIAGNVIGRSVTGAPLGNGREGVAVVSSDVTVTGNVIASNQGPGVLVPTAHGGAHVPVGVTIQENRIVDNAGIPIDLSNTDSVVGDGRSDNNPNGHDDTYGNQLPSKPSAVRAVLVTDGDDDDLWIGGQLERPADDLTEPYRFDVYGNTGPCPVGTGIVRPDLVLGHGEQAQLAGDRYQWLISIEDVQTATFVSATATNDAGSTSEVGGCWPVLLATRTTMGAGHGTDTIEVTDPEVYEIGHFIEIGTGTLRPEVRQVVGKGSLILDEPLEFDHEEGELVTRITEPTAAPAKPTVARENDRDARVSFEGLDDQLASGLTITGYRATCGATGESTLSTEDDASATSLLVAGLTKGKQYLCTVAARNDVGYGAESAGATITIDAPTAPTAAPSPVSVAPSGATGAQVAFGPVSAAANGERPITHYKVSCSAPGRPTRTATKPVPVSSITVTGMVRGATYACKVQAVNDIGAGMASTGKTIKVGIPGQPGTVRNAKGSVIGSIGVLWSGAPANGGAIVRYNVTCAAPGSSKSAVVRQTARAITIKGLVRTKTYTCRVVATNAYGSGASKAAPTGTRPK